MSYEVGCKFGRLTILSVYEESRDGFRKRYMASCRCDCGNEVACEKYNLSTGNTTQCKPCAVAARGQAKKAHGHSMAYKDKNPLGYSCYTRWQAIKRRCYSHSDSGYADYGGRGITVCQSWLDSYENFLADMGLPPTKDHQIDRVNNHGNYEPGNCRWVSRTENSRNRRNNRLISAFGKSQTLSQWEAETGIKRETIAMRITRGYSPEDALAQAGGRIGRKKYATELGQYGSLSEVAEAHGLSISGAAARFASEKFPSWVKA